MTLHPGRVTLQSRRVAGRASRSGVPNLTELTMQHVLQPGYDYADELARTLFWPGQRYAGKIRGSMPTKHQNPTEHHKDDDEQQERQEQLEGCTPPRLLRS